MKNNNLVIGFLAHVDAGKTTLSEAVMYTAGVIRKLGRVDHKTAFLDNDSIEQDRGITVFSKEARFKWAEKRFTLLDTPRPRGLWNRSRKNSGGAGLWDSDNKRF